MPPIERLGGLAADLPPCRSQGGSSSACGSRGPQWAHARLAVAISSSLRWGLCRRPHFAPCPERLGGRTEGARLRRERSDGVAHWMTPSGEFHGASLARCDLELRCTGSAVRRLLRNGRSDFGKALRPARSGQGRRVRVKGRGSPTFHSLGAFPSACETGGVAPSVSLPSRGLCVARLVGARIQGILRQLHCFHAFAWLAASLDRRSQLYESSPAGTLVDGSPRA